MHVDVATECAIARPIGEVAVPTRTAMSLRSRGKPSDFGALMAPIVAMRAANRKDLAMLKSIPESK